MAAEKEVHKPTLSSEGRPLPPKTPRERPTPQHPASFPLRPMTHISSITQRLQASKGALSMALQQFHRSSDELIDNIHDLARATEDELGFYDGMTLVALQRETFFGLTLEDRVSLVLLETGMVFAGESSSDFLNPYQTGF